MAIQTKPACAGCLSLQDLRRTPIDGVDKTVLPKLLGNLKVTLEARTNIQQEDRDLIMQLSPLYLEQIQAAKLEGEQQKQQEIALKMLRKNILTN